MVGFLGIYWVQPVDDCGIYVLAQVEDINPTVLQSQPKSKD